MDGERAERFVVFGLRLLAVSFTVFGVLFLALPDTVLDVSSDFGDSIGGFSRAPETEEKLWLALGFAYMVVIAGICVCAQLDVVRYRALLIVLALGKTASSLAALGFFVFDEDAFIYLLGFLVDGFLVGISMLLWSIAGLVGHSTPAQRGIQGGTPAR